MSEVAEPVGEPGAASASAGAILRRAREARGLHVAALATTLKVPPRRLEALEQDRWNELPDPAFTRALAQTVCRVLKIDPVPVLALLPRADDTRLEQVGGGINKPFRDRPGAGDGAAMSLASRPVAWVVALVLLAAAVVLFWPAGTDQAPAPSEAPAVGTTEAPLPLPAQPTGETGETVEAPAETDAPGGPAGTGATADAGATAAGDPAAATGGPAVSAAPAPEAASAPPAAVEAPPALAIEVTADSWVEVRDATGRVLVSRTLQAGETLPLDASLPAQLTVGNAAATRVLLRGAAVDLAPHQRGNIARLEVK